MAAWSSAAYDGGGQVVATTDALGNTTRYLYDSLGRKVEEVSPYANTASAATVDDSDSSGAFQTAPGSTWYVAPGNGGYDNTYAFASGPASATWTFSSSQNVTAGRYYEVFVTWVGGAGNDTAAVYTVYDGSTSGINRGSVTVNQQASPPPNATFTDAQWLSLGWFYTASGTLTVELAGTSGFLIADAVKIIEVVPTFYGYDPQGNLQYVTVDALPGDASRSTYSTYNADGDTTATISPYANTSSATTVDDGGSGFQPISGSWQTASGGYGNDHTSCTSWYGGSAKWTFSNVQPDTYYQVLVTWVVGTASATYAVYNGSTSGTPLGTVSNLSQQNSPPANPDFTDASGWFSLGYFLAPSQTLIVKLSGLTGVEADAVKIVPVSCTTTTYDANGNVQSVTDPRGYTTNFVYDESNRKTQQILPDPDGSGPLTTSTTTYHYDNNSNLIYVQTPNAAGTGYVQTDYVYDNLNRKTETIQPDPTTGTTSASDPNCPTTLVSLQCQWQYRFSDRRQRQLDFLHLQPRRRADKDDRRLGRHHDGGL